MTSTGAVAFVDVLRRRGVAISVDASAAYAGALTHVDIGDGDAVYWAGRATLVADPAEFETYDAAFADHFGQRSDVGSSPPSMPITITTDDGDGGPLDGTDPETAGIDVRYSATEVLRHADLAGLDEDERVEAYRLIDRLALVPRPRRSARRRPGDGTSSRIDVAATLRAALRTDAEVVRVLRSHRTTRHRRVVMLVDVSGSMEPYARGLLRFAAAAVRARRHVEVFTSGTRLTRVTRDLDHHDPDRAVRAASRAVADFGGGTRLGDVITEFNDTWGIRGLARGALVVVLSDGWDRGDPNRLGEQMARLARVAHRIVWVNPLRASPGYQPLAAGMAAALAHVDSFVDGHSVSSLDDLADLLASETQRRS